MRFAPNMDVVAYLFGIRVRDFAYGIFYDHDME